MRSILNSEIKKETCNSAVFGAYNASVGDSPQYQKSLEDQLKDQSPKEVQDFIHQTAKNIRAYEDAIKSKDFSEERKASFKKLLDAENKRMDLVNKVNFSGNSKKVKSNLKSDKAFVQSISEKFQGKEYTYKILKNQYGIDRVFRFSNGVKSNSSFDIADFIKNQKQFSKKK